MAKKVKLADVLWDAANEHLSADNNDTKNRMEYSCWAVEVACLRAKTPIGAADDFLNSLGCDTGRVHMFNIDGWDKKACRARQGLRYIWLLLAMHVAEDEGIELEQSK